MENPDHLAFLDQGVEAWNGARLEASGLPELDGADLSYRKLAGIIFYAAILGDANLQGSDLEGADLADAWLDGTDLRGARLVRARLGRAQMARCRLDGVTLADHDGEPGDTTQLAALLRGALSWRTFVRENNVVLPELVLSNVSAESFKPPCGNNG